MPNQEDIVKELYGRIDSLPVNKQVIVMELANRMNIGPPVKQSSRFTDIDSAIKADATLDELANPAPKGFKQSFKDALSGYDPRNIVKSEVERYKNFGAQINPSNADFSTIAPATQVAGQAVNDPKGAAGTVAGNAVGMGAYAAAGKVGGAALKKAPVVAKTAKNLTRVAVGELSRIGKALKKAHDEAIGKEPDAPAAPPRKPVKPPPIKNWHTAGEGGSETK